jgi:outer membrane immunogenic protein
LLYGKGGLAVGEVEGGTFFNSDPGVQTGLDTHWRTGWTVGGGMEFALADRWSAKAEYMHYNLGTENFVVQSVSPFGGPSGAPPAEITTRGDIVRVGVNLHFYPVEREMALK